MQSKIGTSSMTSELHRVALMTWSILTFRGRRVVCCTTNCSIWTVVFQCHHVLIPSLLMSSLLRILSRVEKYLFLKYFFIISIIITYLFYYIIWVINRMLTVSIKRILFKHQKKWRNLEETRNPIREL